MRTLVGLQLSSKMNSYGSHEHWLYFDTMYKFFRDVKDPSNLDQLPRTNPIAEYQKLIEDTAQLSGPNDRKTDDNGNDYWVEATTVMGD